MNYVLFECESCDSQMSLGPLRPDKALIDVKPQPCLVCEDGKAVPVRLLNQREQERFGLQADDE